MLATSEGLDPRALEPGRHLVVDAPRGHGGDLPGGALLDDHLSVADRGAIDREAEDALRVWRAERDDALTVGSVCVPHVHEIELFMDVFLREVRTVRGLMLTLAAVAPARVVLEHFDDELAACVTELLAAAGTEVERRGRMPPPDYPIGFRRPPAGGGRSLVSKLRESAGIPGRARGSVLILPWWNLEPLWAAADRRGLTPVLEPLRLPDLPRSQILRHAARGGWISQPAGRERRRSRCATLAALASARGDGAAPPRADAGGGLERLLDRRALRLLEQRALDSAARARSVERDFARGRLLTAVAPSDATPDIRMIAGAARQAGRSIAHVQHGFVALRPGGGDHPPSFVDGMVAGHVGTWTEDYAGYLRKGAPGRVLATGSPVAPVAAGGAQADAQSTLLLIAQPSPLSAIAGARVTARHLDAALAALSAVRPGSRVIVRPHPLDRQHGLYAAAAARHPELELSLDARTSIESLFDVSDLCVGTVSTATLQAAACGVPTVLLDVAEARLSWPFDGSDAFPLATDAETLGAAISAVLEAPEPPGAEAARVALGADPDALANVLDLISDAVAH